MLCVAKVAEDCTPQVLIGKQFSVILEVLDFCECRVCCVMYAVSCMLCLVCSVLYAVWEIHVCVNQSILKHWKS